LLNILLSWFKVCLVFQRKSVEVSPGNGSEAYGLCGTNVQFIIIYVLHQSVNLNLTFNFTKDNEHIYHMNSFSLEALVNNISIDGW